MNMIHYEKRKVFSFPKSKHEEVQFAVRNWKGKPYASIQVYHIADDGARESTEKEFFIAAEKLPDFKEGIEQLISAIEKVKAE